MTRHRADAGSPRNAELSVALDARLLRGVRGGSSRRAEGE